MSDTTQVLSNAIEQMQETQQRLVAAVTALSQHDLDENAHEEIRKLIYALQESETIYTRTEIVNLVKETINSHTNATFSTAHSGWTEYNDALQLRLTQLETNLQNLKNKVDGVADETATALERELQAVEDYYAPLLANAQTGFSDAEAAGSTELANQYRALIASTLDQKKTAILAVLTEYQSS